VQLLRREKPEAIAPDMWPPISPDIKPVHLGSDAGMSLPHENTGRDRSAAGNEHLGWLRSS